MSRMTRIFLTAICAFALITACGDDDDNGNGNNEAQENNATEAGFSGGSFTFTAEDVTDSCFDGAMVTVIDPPSDFPDPVSIPAFDELPADLDITFNEPFDDVQGVEFEPSGDNGLRTSGDGFEQIGVDIGTAEGDECDADMMVTAELISTDEDTFTGTGTLEITRTEGDNCPGFLEGPPCEVTTTLTATRAE